MEGGAMMERSEVRKVRWSRVEGYRRSGLSARGSCEAHGAHPDRLRCWLALVVLLSGLVITGDAKATLQTRPENLTAGGPLLLFDVAMPGDMRAFPAGADFQVSVSTDE